MSSIGRIVLILGCLLAQNAMLATPIHAQSRRQLPDVEGVEHFRMQSELLTEFWGRPMFIEAGVVLPPAGEGGGGDAPLPVCYSVHGFGGSHRSAWRSGPTLRSKMSEEGYPRMLYVYLNAQFSLGHHEFADSVNNGPWGEALTTEFIPALEKKYNAAGVPAGRFVTGHSSGGWSSLWLQVKYPMFFNGCWSTAPDSIDFRDFTGINIYEFENAYVDPDGNEIQLMRRGTEWVRSLRQYVDQELSRSDYGGQFASFDAVFSPRGEDGRPQPMFDRESGKIDPEVAAAWKKYDIGLVLKEGWDELAEQLKGKVHVYMGEQDTFRLEGAVKRLAPELKEMGSDADIILVEGRSHGSLMQPHPEHWPEGMIPHIHQEMLRKWNASK